MQKSTPRRVHRESLAWDDIDRYARSAVGEDDASLPASRPTLARGLADHYIGRMCGRIIQSSAPLRYAIVDGMNVRDSRLHNHPPRWNAAPSQDLLVIRRNHRTGEVSLDPLRWGLIPNWCDDPKGGRKPINAKCETVRDLPAFREAYRGRRCIVPVDGFFEWKAIKGRKAKQPYAIAMKDGAPFGLAGIWENWKEPASGDWIRTFAIITTDANELVAEIHDRMPVILAPADYALWLGEEDDPHGLMRSFPAPLMRMWPISPRVNKPENDDAAIVEPIEAAIDAASCGKAPSSPSRGL
jgi:putative SOS response-associated peptidase YedK